MNHKIFRLMCYLCFLVLLFLSQKLPGQNKDQRDTEKSLLSFKLTPGVSIPLGEESAVFHPGAGGDLSMKYRLPFLPLLCLDLAVGYDLMPIKVHPTKDENSFSMFHGGIGPGISWDITPRLNLGVSTQFGYYYCFFNRDIPELDASEKKGGNPYLASSLGFSFLLIPSLSIGVEGAYRNFLGNTHDILVSLGLAYHIQPPSKRIEGLPLKPEPLKFLELTEIEMENVFPVFFKYYDDHALGKATLRNKGSQPVEDIKVSLFVKQYMDNPKECKVIKKLEGGEEQLVILYGLFTEKVLEISEGTKVSANITVESSQAGKGYLNEYVQTLRLYDRNAITWDDDRKAAAFVTAKDPTVLKFAKNISGIVKDLSSAAINPNMRLALGLHEALSLYGMSYVIDPSTPYKEFSKQKWAVDYLQFPRQSLEYKAGDCDDLSILYSALLESIGVKTAFITIPGHIYMAFALDMEPAAARKHFFSPADFIFDDDNTWVPVEVTAIGGGFLKAWQIGAKAWQEYSARGEANFYPMHSSWEAYEPVGFSGQVYELSLPDADALASHFDEEFQKFVSREIFPRETKLLERIKGSPGNPKLINELGVLYARYGLYDKAKVEFEKILQRQEYTPALINMGNIHFMEKRMERALYYYEQAQRKDPYNGTVLLNLAKVKFEMGDYAAVKEAYDRLKKLFPNLAKHYAYLEMQGDETKRASGYEKNREVMIWEEEEES